MPLKITNPSKEAAVLNRWAETVENKLRKIETHPLIKAGFVNTTHSNFPTLYYQTDQSAGTNAILRSKNNFLSPFTVTDNFGNDSTDIGLGIVPLTKGGTGADLSATGGTSQVLKQITTGAVITVGRLAASDLSDTATLGNYLRGNGTSFVSSAIQAGDIPAPAGDITGTYIATVVSELQGIPLLYAPTPSPGQVLQYDGVNWTPTNASASTAQILYLDKAADAIGGLYKVWALTPDTSAEATVTTTITSGSGTVEFADFITPSGYPDVTLLPAGDWQYDLYAQVSSSAGTTNLIVGWYKRASGGTETLLFSKTINLSLLNTAIQLYSSELVEVASTLLATDRLVLKLSANTTRALNTTITVYTNGTTHYSHVHSTFGTGSSAPVQSVFGRTGRGSCCNK